MYIDADSADDDDEDEGQFTAVQKAKPIIDNSLGITILYCNACSWPLIWLHSALHRSTNNGQQAMAQHVRYVAILRR